MPGFRHHYAHTDSMEIAILVRLLNQLGFWVDIIDRGISPQFTPEDKYDLFIGNGPTDSGRYFTHYARRLTKATKILYARAASAQAQNKRLHGRAREFTARTGSSISARREIVEVDMDTLMAETDYLFCVGNKTTIDTYSSYHKKTYKIFLPTAPFLSLDIQAISQKSQESWLFFAGNGNLLKGLDLGIETFAGLPHLNLYICTPLEPEFLNYYAPLLNQAPNIHLEGFIPVDGRRFQTLTRQCGFVLSPSASEGTATSVLTCMRRGLIPVVTPETGLDTENFGIVINDISIPALRQHVNMIAGMGKREFTDRISRTYVASFKYTRETFERSFIKALLSVLQTEKKI